MGVVWAVINHNKHSDKFQSERIDSLWFILTYKCQFDCPWCYTRSGLRRSDLQFSSICKISDFFYQLGGKNVVLIGGEPLIYPQIIHTIKKCRSLGFNTVLITNGERLRDNAFVEELKNSGLTRLTLSIKNFEHQNSRANFSHKFDVVEVIKNLIRNNINFEISSLIVTTEIKYYLNLIELCRNLGINSILFQTYLPSVSAHKPEKITFFPKIYSRLIEKIYAYCLKYKNFTCEFVFQYPICLLDGDLAKQMFSEKRLFGSHEIIMTGRGFALDPQGYILPSSHWVGYPLFHIDEIMEDGELSRELFFQKWNSKTIIEFRKRLWRYVSPKCENCEYWATCCVGGNPLIWRIWSERDLLPD